MKVAFCVSLLLPGSRSNGKASTPPRSSTVVSLKGKGPRLCSGGYKFCRGLHGIVSANRPFSLYVLRIAFIEATNSGVA
jgi:hypothetical protein